MQVPSPKGSIGAKSSIKISPSSGKQQATVSEIVEDRIDIMSGINKNEIELAPFLHQCWKNRGRGAGAQRDESFQLGKTPTPDLFNRTELAAVFPVQARSANVDVIGEG